MKIIENFKERYGIFRLGFYRRKGSYFSLVRYWEEIEIYRVLGVVWDGGFIFVKMRLVGEVVGLVGGCYCGRLFVAGESRGDIYWGWGVGGCRYREFVGWVLVFGVVGS